MPMASETATQRSLSAQPEWSSQSSRAERVSFNFGLLAALVACLVCWIVVALSAYWLI